ncbi:MAG: hypothetical protein EHM93_00545 [Bacteroidales bacterium]|nr:MAG: hypothetical protein EHM93_00545 [Bacteroidales bacterium]
MNSFCGRIGIFLFIISPLAVKSQEGAKSLSFIAIEDSLSSLMKQIYSDAPISGKEVANSNFTDLFRKTLANKETFNYPFDSLKHLGKITSEDKRVRVFTWNFPQPGGYQKYFGYILLKKDNRDVQLIELNDSRKVVSDPINSILGANSWMGALYYSIVDVSYKGKAYYILLGLDFNNLFSSKKIIEILSFGKDAKPVFGFSVFQVDDVALSRVVFEYSARVNMTLRYIPESNSIVFDHLSPMRPDLADNFQFYGPDFTYDGFKFEKGKWIYVRNLDLRNPKRGSLKPRESPERFPDPGFLYKSKGGIPYQMVK